MFAGGLSPAVLGTLGAIELFVLAVLVPLFAALFFLRERLLKRIVLFAVMVSAIYAAEIWWSNAVQPQKSSGLAVAQLKSDNAAANELRMFEAGKEAAHLGAEPLVIDHPAIEVVLDAAHEEALTGGEEQVHGVDQVRGHGAPGEPVAGHVGGRVELQLAGADHEDLPVY